MPSLEQSGCDARHFLFWIAFDGHEGTQHASVGKQEAIWGLRWAQDLAKEQSLLLLSFES